MDMTQLFKKLLDENFTINCVAIKRKWLEIDTESNLIKYQSKFKNNFFCHA